ncbi:MAG: hypothetical protein V2A76_10575 [Planctomycetota bacterium]
MKTHRIAALALAALCPFTPARAAEAPARSYLAGVAIGQQEVLRFQLSSPRMTMEELTKAISDETIRTALNQNHLAQLGILRISRTALLSSHLLEAGTYGVGLRIDESAGFTLILASDTRSIPIHLQTTLNASGATPQLTISFLAEDSIEAFQLELRFGALRGTAALSFARDDVVAGMNNLAYEILMQKGEPQTALRLATCANELTEGAVPGILDTLALAQYANGQTEDAIQTQTRALAAMGDQRGKERARMESQLRAFELGRK